MSSKKIILKIHADLFASLYSNETNENFTVPAVFECVCSKEYLITTNHNDFTYYLSLSFDPNYFCFVQGLVHVYTVKLYDVEKRVKSFVLENFEFSLESVFLGLFNYLQSSYNKINEVYHQLTYKPLPTKDQFEIFCGELAKNKSFSVLDVSIEEFLNIIPMFTTELNNMSEILKVAINHLLNASLNNSYNIISSFKLKFYSDILAHYKEYIHIEDIFFRNCSIYSTNSLLRAEKIRECFYFNNLQHLCIQPTDFFNSNQFHPIFNLECSSLSNLFEKHKKSDIIHIIILVHGYRGHSSGMSMLKGYISMIYPNTYVFSSKVNEKKPELSIKIQGKRLAKEIKFYIQSLKVSLDQLKISFIGHSMGGLVSRAAIPRLKKLKNCFFGFTSLSSPHIGVIYPDNLLLKIGK